MPNLKISQLTADAAPTSDDLIPTVHDTGGTPANRKVTLADLFKAIQTWVFAQDAGSTDTYVATLSPAPSAYVTGLHYRFKANTANTGAATINFNSLGAKTIKKAAGGITTDLADNDIRVGQWVDLVYDGTNMQMQSQLGNVTSGGAPGAHATTHQNGGGDEVDITGLSGVLADPQTPITENVQDIVGAMVIAGTNITVTYNDGAGTLTIDSSGGGGTPAGASGSVQYNDAGAFGGSNISVNASALFPVTSGNIDLGLNSNRWNQFHANDVIATGTGAGGGRVRFFGSGGNAAEIASNTNRKSINFIDGVTGNAGTISFKAHTPAQFGANQNNYTEEGGNSHGFFRWSSDASRDVTGLSISQEDGDVHLIVNVGSNNIVLKHQDGNSTDVNRFLNSTGADITLAANQAADAIYDGTTQRWRVFKRN